jgi:integrase
MAKEFNGIISEMGKAKRRNSGERKTTAGPRGRRSTAVPEYEDISNWRGIESALAALRFDHATAFDVTAPKFIDWNIGGDGVSLPFELSDIAVQRAGSSVRADSMWSAITSALGAMRPKLLRMAESDTKGPLSEKDPSSETLCQYKRFAERLVCQYQTYSGERSFESINWIKFADWFLTRRVDLKSASWHAYRSALTFYLQRIPDDDAAIGLSLIHSTDDMVGARKSELSLRVKYFSSDDFDRILYHCERHPSQANINLSNFLKVNVRIGLRPTEFLTSELRIIQTPKAPFGRQVWLFVCNAKYTRGRANGPIRLLDLSSMSDKTISVISSCIDEVKMLVEMLGYDEWLRKLNRALARVENSPKSAMKTKYTAYSTRHQAIASWKSMYDPITVAALAGHAMPSTAQRHYGSAKHAWPNERLTNMIVGPSLADVERVRDRAEMARRIGARAASGGLAPEERADDLAPSVNAG